MLRTPLEKSACAALFVLGSLITAAAQEGAPPQAPAKSTREFNPLDPLEPIARDAQAALREGLALPLSSLDFDALAEWLGPDLEARFPGPDDSAAVASPGGGLEIQRFLGEELETIDGEAVRRRLAAMLEDWVRVEQAQLSLTRFAPRTDGDGARAVARLDLTGDLGDGSRAELHGELELELAFQADPHRWSLTHLAWLDGHRVRGKRPRFEDVSAPTGLDLNLSPTTRRLVHKLVDERSLWLIGGLSVIDWNHDGFPDLFAARHEQLAALFINDGRGGFRREALPLESARELPGCFLFLDLDGDGLEELVPGIITAQEGRRAWLGIYTRRGDEWVHLPRALELELEPGARDPRVQTIVPSDVDGDGRLDLYIGVELDSRSSGGFSTPLDAFDGGVDALFMNHGGLSFAEEAGERGLANRQYTTAATFFDADSDGDPDLFLATAWGQDRLFQNDGKGHFSPRADVALSAKPSFSGGTALCYVDGELAVLATNPFSALGSRIAAAAAGAQDELHAYKLALSGGNRLFVREGESGEWNETAAELGVSDAGWAFGPLFFDIENDGDQDLFVSNGVTTHSDASLPDFERLLWRQVEADALALRLNMPRVLADAELLMKFNGSYAGGQRECGFVRAGEDPERWFDAAYVLGLDLVQDGRSSVALDFDGDGDLDLATYDLLGLRLLRNRGGAGHFARVALIGDQGAASAIGAEIELEAAGRVQRALVTAVSGHASQVLLEEHFGLGDATRIERVSVRWPSGETETWEDLPADRRIVLTRGNSEAVSAEIAAWPEPEHARPRPRASMKMRLPRAKGGEGNVATTGRPAVVHIWSPGVEGSLAPFAELAELATTNAGRVRFAGVCVDGDAAVASALPIERGARFMQFLADDAFLENTFGVGREPELPTTLVFDAAGKLRRVFVGGATAEEVGGVLASLLDDDVFVADLVREAEWMLQVGDGAGALDSLRRALRGDPGHPRVHLALGRLYILLGNMEQAEIYFARAVSADPGITEAQLDLGSARLELGRIPEAVEAFEAAWRVNGDDLRILNALGNAYVEDGRLENALQSFERGSEMAPEDPRWLFMRGRALGDLGRDEEAREVLRQALELAPNFVSAQAALDALDAKD